MVQHTNGNTRWATKQKYECVIRTHGTTYKIQIQDERLNKSMNVLCWHMVQHTNGTQDERLNKSMNVLRTHGTTYKWKYKMSD